MKQEDGPSNTIANEFMAGNIVPYRDLEDVYASEDPTDIEEAIRLDVEAIQKEVNDGFTVTYEEFDHNNEDVINNVISDESAKHGDGGEVGLVDEPVKHGDGGEVGLVDEPTIDGDVPIEPIHEPRIGTIFANASDAYELYNMYGRKMGFSVRKSKVEWSRKKKDGTNEKGDVLSRLYVCSREGFKSTTDRREQGKEVNRRAESRIGCPARMRVKLVQGVGYLVVDQFISAHNHTLVPPEETFRLRSHQWLSDLVVQIATTLDNCGIGPATIYEVVKSMSGGASKVGLPEVAFKNFMKRKNQKFLGMDLKRLLEYLHHSKMCDPEFFCKIAATNDGSVRGIFWVDGQARAAYRLFGDVLIFDTTYKKNRYHFPFGPFTGVNHHGQTILFGCGLIADETIESFIWLFSTWLTAMGDQQPVAIITDQCPSILRSISHVFPSSKHRFCSWHVQKHFMEHLSHLYGLSKTFKNDFGRCIYGSKKESEFETSWQELLIQYNLTDHEWLKKMYEQRVHWVPLYLRGTFFAGMSSTQRSEGMNYYFRGFFKQSIPLHKFAMQYERAIQRRREREASSDFTSINTEPPLLVGNPLEVHASMVYTRKNFEIFKKQWSAGLVLAAKEVEVEGKKRMYVVGPFDAPDKHKCEVWDDIEEGIITCSCKYFEFMGLLCKHILRVFHKTDHREIPSRYILKRWTIAARHDWTGDRGLSKVASGSVRSMWALQDSVRNLIATVSGSEEACESATTGIRVLIEKISQEMGASNLGTNSHCVVDSQHSSNASHDLIHNLHIPLDVVTKGRPSLGRAKHPTEQNKRKNRCSICKELGHNKSKCKKLKAAAPNEFGAMYNEDDT